jgi:predicted nucleotidyltransferase
MKSTDIVNEGYVKGNVEYHDRLSPNAWRGNEMIPEVRMHLLKIALFFAKSIEIPNFRVLDVVLAGSMANFNYTKFSDFDIHVVTRYSDLDCDDLAEEFYRAKKSLWNDQHDIMVNGHEAELYVEDIDQPPVSGGVYSLLEGKWIKEPNYDRPEIDDGAIEHKVKDLIKQIDSMLASADDPADLKRLTDKLRKMRRAGLDSVGEFGTENLSFKILRNLGYLDKLHDAYIKMQDAELGLKEGSLEQDQHPNSPPPGPEFKPTMPAGTVRVDVSDVYDWYKLGKNIMNLRGLQQKDFGKGPPSTIVTFGSEDEEHKYIKDLDKLGLDVTDIDPPYTGHEKVRKVKTDPTYNVDGTPYDDIDENFANGKKPGRKGLAKRMGVDCSQPVSKLRSIASHSSGEKQRMAHWCANMKSGRSK